MSRRLMVLMMVAALALGLLAPTASADDTHVITYEVTIENLSNQPLSPAVAATHVPGLGMWIPGELASAELIEIAENGNQIPAFDALSANPDVTSVVDVGVPLTPRGTEVGDFTDSVTFTIEGYPGDRLSLATMLICSNDGFTGVTNLRLPNADQVRMTRTRAYDAGSEANTEVSEDIVDPCSGLGLVALDGDPDGNNNEGIDTEEGVAIHPGVSGEGELTRMDHGWRRSIAKVTIVAVNGGGEA